MKVIELRVNGTRRRVDLESERSLLSVLRDDLDLTGAKYGCGEGQCGACTVLIDGQPVRSCVTKVSAIAGKQVTTIEGLEQSGRLHPLQEAFLEAGAMQCGYCIPGMIMSGVGLLKKNPHPSEPDIARAMEGNICRCGTYPRIVAAIRQATSGDKAQKGVSND
jgi:isoquinoline 1-oxidoreductase subunit alpha